MPFRCGAAATTTYLVVKENLPLIAELEQLSHETAVPAWASMEADHWQPRAGGSATELIVGFPVTMLYIRHDVS